MATIVQLTAAQLFAAVTATGDSTGQIGRWTYDSLTSRISNLPPQMNVLNIVYNECAGLISDAGLDITNLTNSQSGHAYYAMAYSAAYKLLLEDSAGASTLPAENFQNVRQEFGQRVQVFWNLAAKHYDELGISRTANPYFNSAAFGASFNLVDRNSTSSGYPFKNQFTSIP